MPPTNLSALRRMAAINGSEIPKKILNNLAKLTDQKSKEDFAIETSLEIIDKLITNGAPGIHLYTMNNTNLGERIAKKIAT